MEKILITGAMGQLGLALQQLFLDNTEYQCYRTDAFSSEDGTVVSLDITDKRAVLEYTAMIKPDIIINCAAFTAVDLCESEEDKAYRINAIGPKNLAIAAESVGAKLVHVSTDYVYDGQGNRPYVEEDEPNPLSVYGRSKLQGDLFAMEACERTFILRTAWVYGEGKNFVKTMLRLAETGNPIRVVADQYGTPTSALELAKAIIAVMSTEEYGIYHATCEGSSNWFEFAKTIFTLAGKEVVVTPITTEEYPTPAKRPQYSVLENKALKKRIQYDMADWIPALEEYMKTLF